MSWRLRIWCDDCSFGQDPQGCFGGGEDVSDEVFATKDEADRFACTVTGPWDCQVVECEAIVNASFDPNFLGPKLPVAVVP